MSRHARKNSKRNQEQASAYDETMHLKAENIRLQAQNEFLAAFVSGGIPAVIDLAVRDRLMLYGVLNTIDEMTQIAEGGEQDSQRKLLDEKKRYEEQSATLPIPLTVEIIDRMATTLEHERVRLYNQTTTAIQQRGYTTIREMLQRNLKIAALAGGREVQINLLRQLPSLFTNPYVVCFELLKECHILGEPNLHTAARLDMEWIKENINTRIGSHIKFCDALKHAYQYYKSISKNDTTRANQDRYAYDHILSIDALRKYIDYFDKTKELANKVSDDLKEKYPDVLN